MTVFRRGSRIFIDWNVVGPDGRLRTTPGSHRRFVVVWPLHWDRWVATILLARGAKYALRKSGRPPMVPTGLPWGEVGQRDALPVPPGRGEGGSYRSPTLWDEATPPA